MIESYGLSYREMESIDGSEIYQVVVVDEAYRRYMADLALGKFNRPDATTESTDQLPAINDVS